MSTTTSISVPYQSCNNQNLTLFDLSAFKFLETVEIDSGNFLYTTTFVIDGIFDLRNVTILKNSFTQHPNGYGNDSNKSFHILNCDKLESISIGEYSFSDYGGEFELSNLPQLQSIVIGNINSNSYNFYSTPFDINSMIYINDLYNRFTRIDNIINW